MKSLAFSYLTSCKVASIGALIPEHIKLWKSGWRCRKDTGWSCKKLEMYFRTLPHLVEAKSLGVLLLLTASFTA
eukprot:3837160-Amphidinium_carterae.1